MTTNSPVDFSQRDPLDSVNELFSKRWSPRAFTPTPVTDQQLQTVLEAARWSPSCFNAQPWQFITSTSETHGQFLALLADLNQAWAKNASVIGFIVAEKNFAHNGNSNTFASFDCGAAWMAMTLQAQQLGLYTHGMGGINYDEVYKTFNLDVETHQVVCGFALGSIGDAENLPEAFREKEKPTPRKALSDMWRQGI